MGSGGEIPPEWYGGDLGEIEALAENLLKRRSRIRELIEAFGKSDRKPFPKWLKTGEKGEIRDWNEMRWGSKMTGSVN